MLLVNHKLPPPKKSFYQKTFWKLAIKEQIYAEKSCHLPVAQKSYKQQHKQHRNKFNILF